MKRKNCKRNEIATYSSAKYESLVDGLKEEETGNHRKPSSSVGLGRIYQTMKTMESKKIHITSAICANGLLNWFLMISEKLNPFYFQTMYERLKYSSTEKDLPRAAKIFTVETSIKSPFLWKPDN